MIRQAGIPWKESETALPRHQDTQLSLLSLMRDFQTELPANSCRFFTLFIGIPIEEYHYRLCPSSSQWKGEKKNCFNSIDKWKIKFRISINFSSRLWRGVRLSVEWERVWENVIATLVRLRIDPITVVHAFLRIRFSRSIPPLFLSCIIRDTRTRNKDRSKRNRQHVKMSDASNGCVGMQKTSPRASSIVGIYARLLHFPLSRALSFSFSRGK